MEFKKPIVYVLITAPSGGGVVWATHKCEPPDWCQDLHVHEDVPRGGEQPLRALHAPAYTATATSVVAAPVHFTE